MPELVLNLSRIGKMGTGLYVFSKNIVAFLQPLMNNVTVVMSPSIELDNCDKIIHVPGWVSMTQAVSRVRPLLWLFYAYFMFPRRHSRILSTTHHGVPWARRQVITIHDIRPYFYPDSFLQRFYFRHLLPKLAQKVDGILTVSETVKRLICQCYNIVPDKIHVVPNSVDVSRFCPSDKVQSEALPYLLMVGATWGHKNALEVLRMSDHWVGKYRKNCCGRRFLSASIRAGCCRNMYSGAY